MTVYELISAIVGKQKADKAEWFYDNMSIVFAIDNTIIYRVPYTPTEEIDRHTLVNLRLIQTYEAIKEKIKEYTVANLTNLQDDPRFGEMLSMKSKDGIDYYYVRNNANSYLARIPIYAGLFKVNKGDTLDINIYPYNFDYYLNEVIIHKKKINKPVYHYLLTLRDN